MNTKWSTPRTNILAALLLLRQALAAGYNARLVRARNEDCDYPIKEKHVDEDFRNYEFSSGLLRTRAEIYNDTSLSDIQKYLTLSFKTCYGTQEAMTRYYNKGLLSADNFKGQGRSHLVKVDDMVRFLVTSGEHERAQMFKRQYLSGEEAGNNHFYDFFRYKHGSQWAIKKFKTRLWVVELLKDDQPKARVPWAVTVLNVISYPLKYVPRKSVLRMADYKVITYRVGSVVNGLSIEFHVPKKFGFSNNYQ
jgi:hypothetical protein